MLCATTTPPTNPVLAARRAARLTQAQLAVKAGISPSTVALAERFGLITQRTAEKLSTVLGVQPEELRP